MKRYAYEPTVAKLEKALPYSTEVPKGFRVHAQQLCRWTLGRSYYAWAPQWKTQWHSGHRWVCNSGKPWAVNEDAVWQYRDGRLYFKDEGNIGMVTMAMLSKPKRRK
jgi:hypothetical protein